MRVDVVNARDDDLGEKVAAPAWKMKGDFYGLTSLDDLAP
jgi:hypothetical protein